MLEYYLDLKSAPSFNDMKTWNYQKKHDLELIEDYLNDNELE